jgi:hypothetical protein
MRRCAVCGEDIARHTRETLSLLTLKAIHSAARNPADARRLVRTAERRCPLAVDRQENGMTYLRAQRESTRAA